MSKLEKLLILVQTGLSVYKSNRADAAVAFQFNLLFATSTLNYLLKAIDEIDEAKLPENLGEAAYEYILWQDQQFHERPHWLPK